MDEYSIIRRNPTAEEYQLLRKAVGWADVEPGATESGLRNSLFSVCAIHQGVVVGVGRVVGDGGIYFYLQDIIVHPKHQGKNVGRSIMDVIMKYIESAAQEGAFVGLMAAEGVARFYDRYGFTIRPENRPGMFMRIK